LFYKGDQTLLHPAVPELSTSLTSFYCIVSHLTTRYQLVLNRAVLGYKQNIAAAFEYATTNQQTCQQLSRSPAYFRYMPDTGLHATGPRIPSKESFPSLIPSRVISLKQISIVIHSSQSLSRKKSLPICASTSSPSSLHSALQLWPKVFLIRSRNVL
jgi:hypothetical protein